jgi:hypothetical protein
MTDETQNTDQQDATSTEAVDTQSHDTVDWETRYKSLQRVQEQKRQKLDQQIADLTTKHEQALLETQEKKQAAEILEKQQAQFLKEKGELEGKLQVAQAEQESLNKKVLFQKIILEDFSDLADMSDYIIPVATTEEEVRSKATALREKMGKRVQASVKEVMTGASSTVQGTGNTIPTSSEEEALWRKIYDTAGRVGKEEEFAKANKDLQDFLARKSKQ